MDIKDHRLVGHWYKKSPNSSSPLQNPTLLVFHYTASGGADGKGDADYLVTSAAKASAHVVIGRDGSIHQIVPFNERAWHAGVSTWRGQSNVNNFSIGIEIDNWGPLTKREDGTFRSWTGAVVPPEKVTKARHKNENVERYWETFTDEQLQALVTVSRAIKDRYGSIREIVGHDDIAPKRKQDPGPAFPMNSIITRIGGRDHDVTEYRVVIASALNLRGGPGTQFDRVGPALVNGSRVEIVFDAGQWAQIRTKDGRTGWVNDQWLRLA